MIFLAFIIIIYVVYNYYYTMNSVTSRQQSIKTIINNFVHGTNLTQPNSLLTNISKIFEDITS